MENKLLESVSSSFNVEIPQQLQTMDQHLDWILPKVRPWSEDLREEEFFLHTRWMEVNDRDDMQEAVLHIFLPDGQYLYSVDGNITEGHWSILEKTNTFIWERTGLMKELYDLAFLSQDFFILKKHGDQQRKNQSKYFVMGREGVVGRLSWRNSMELLFNKYRNSSSFYLYVFLIAAVIALFLILSLFR